MTRYMLKGIQADSLPASTAPAAPLEMQMSTRLSTAASLSAVSTAMLVRPSQEETSRTYTVSNDGMPYQHTGSMPVSIPAANASMS